MDEVNRLLEQFADHVDDMVAVTGAPPVDVDADVARGRRALRRVRARRRTVGVLCVAAATALVVAIGNPARWWAEGDAGVATDHSTPAVTPTRSPSATARPSLFSVSAPPVTLVSNSRAWPGLDCRLVPAGWRQQSARAGYVVLAPPVPTGPPGAVPSGTLVVRTAADADPINGAQAFRTAGRIVHLGRYAGGERAGQVQVGDRWLIVRLPLDEAGWTDSTLQRMIGSCTIR